MKVEYISGERLTNTANEVTIGRERAVPEYGLQAVNCFIKLGNELANSCHVRFGRLHNRQISLEPHQDAELNAARPLMCCEH